MLYVGRVWLKYTEEEFWMLTPRKFMSQINVRADLLKQKAGNKKSNAKDGYIDQLPGW